MVTHREPWEADLSVIAEAVIMQACTDYLYCLLYGWAPKANEHKVNTVECEQFFRSDYCDHLISSEKLTGEDIITEMRSAAQRIRAMRYKARRAGRYYEVFDIRTGEGTGIRYTSMEYARRDAARLDGLTTWQYMIAVAEDRKPHGGRKSKCANGKQDS